MIKTTAVQLYTLREETAKDFFGTLEMVAAIGFDAVEFAGYFGFSAEKINEKLDNLGLTALSAHISLQEITEKAEEIITFHQTLGCHYIVCPWSEMKTATQAAEVAKKLLAVQPFYEKAGMTLCYHNHDFEFITADGILPIEEFIAATNGKIKLEVDTFWVENAGFNAPEFLRKHQDIISLIHLKDGKIGAGEAGLSAIGEGEIDISAMLAAAEEIGLTSFIVENDHPKPNGTENMKQSIKNLKMIKGV